MALCYKSTHKIHKFYRKYRSDVWGNLAKKRKSNFMTSLVFNYAKSNLNQKVKTLPWKRRKKIFRCFPRQLIMQKINIILQNL